MHELYLLFLSLSLLLFSGLKLLSAFRKKQHCPDLNLTDLSAVIPFRNEALTLTKFLASLKIQSVLPAKIIFVNDHSEDDSVKIIEQFINKYGLGTLIHLPQGEAGKKAALNRSEEHTSELQSRPHLVCRLLLEKKKKKKKT